MFERLQQAHAVTPKFYLSDYLRWYFLRKRSTRPSVSTNFALPVKNGWQAEHTSIMYDFVERVSYLAPQAHLMVTSLYSGCILAFMLMGPYL